jgi:hypothetical protein
MLAVDRRGWWPSASARPGGITRVRDVGLSARRSVPGSAGALVALADGSDGRTAFSCVALACVR